MVVTESRDVVSSDSCARRILVVDDHRLVGELLVLALERKGYEAELAECASAGEILRCAARFRPHAVVLDLELAAAGDGRTLIRPLVEGGAAVLVVSAVTDRMDLATCLEAGAVGTASKALPLTAVVEQVGRVVRGERVLSIGERAQLLAELGSHRRAVEVRRAPFESLTPRERVVLGMMVNGQPAADIARASYVSLPTVRSQIRSILQKLEVNSQMAAAALARNAGWTPPDDPPARERRHAR